MKIGNLVYEIIKQIILLLIAEFEYETYETQCTDPTKKHLPGEILEEIVSSPGILVLFF